MLDLDALKKGGISVEEAESILSLDGLPQSILDIAGSLRDERLGRELLARGPELRRVLGLAVFFHVFAGHRPPIPKNSP